MAKRVLFPFIRLGFIIMFMFGFLLYFVEVPIRLIILPLVWILFGNKASKWLLDEGFISWFAENRFYPFFERLGMKCN